MRLGGLVGLGGLTGALFLGLALYEALAMATRRPTLSDLTRTRLAFVPWAAWTWIGLHLLIESRRR